MTIDFRALCADLLRELDRPGAWDYRQVLKDQARTALAQPEPEGRPAPAPAGERQAAPVPVAVSERLPGPEDCTANPRNGEGEWCWGWRQDSSNSPFSGRWRMVPRAFMVEEATHWLPFNALPLPQGEVEP